METSELLKKVRRIEIKTRGLSRNIFAGQYHSAFKGRGMAFSEVREYQYGDDIRDIDWNVTARYVGEEPTSQVTGLYNQIMCEQLPKAGIECVVVPRKEANGKAISASTVRQCLQSGDWDTLETLLPKTSLDYFRSPEAEPVLARIRNAGNVVHY